MCGGTEIMRDHLCIEEDCIEGIDIYTEAITENKAEIKSLTEDIKKGVQEEPNDIKKMIEGRHLINLLYGMENIRAKYSIGKNISTIEEDFEYALIDIKNTRKEDIGYLNLLWMISPGILLETDKENMKILAKIVENQDMKDFVIDYLLCASNRGWTKVNNTFFKEARYTKTKEIIDLAETDKEAASERLHTYMEKEWFQGHYDYEWRNAHKEPGYVGFWSFETAAIAKILKLDDESLQNNIHYHYYIVHYKNNIKFMDISLYEYLEKSAEEEPDTWIEDIDNHPALEKIIPGRWHTFVNELISDYQVLNDDRFMINIKNQWNWSKFGFIKMNRSEERRVGKERRLRMERYN